MAAGDGLVTMTPTSIVVAGAGSSASINADGGVDFTAVTSLSLNGVFVSGIDNYLIVFRATVPATANIDISAQLRVGGTDATAGNYAYQVLQAVASTPSGSRSTSQTNWRMCNMDSAVAQNGSNFHIYGPALAQPTAFRSVGVSAFGSATLLDSAGTHSLSTAYDGITLVPSSSSITGQVTVFGYEE